VRQTVVNATRKHDRVPVDAPQRNGGNSPKKAGADALPYRLLQRHDLFTAIAPAKELHQLYQQFTARRQRLSL